MCQNRPLIPPKRHLSPSFPPRARRLQSLISSDIRQDIKKTSDTKKLSEHLEIRTPSLFTQTSSQSLINRGRNDDRLEMEFGTRREAVLGCGRARMVSGIHGIWGASGTFQDCKNASLVELLGL